MQCGCSARPDLLRQTCSIFVVNSILVHQCIEQGCQQLSRSAGIAMGHRDDTTQHLFATRSIPVFVAIWEFRAFDQDLHQLRCHFTIWKNDMIHLSGESQRCGTHHDMLHDINDLLFERSSAPYSALPINCVTLCSEIHW